MYQQSSVSGLLIIEKDPENLPVNIFKSPARIPDIKITGMLCLFASGAIYPSAFPNSVCSSLDLLQ